MSSSSDDGSDSDDIFEPISVRTAFCLFTSSCGPLGLFYVKTAPVFSAMRGFY
jgi:hypothetical protein